MSKATSQSKNGIVLLWIGLSVVIGVLLLLVFGLLVWVLTLKGETKQLSQRTSTGFVQQGNVSGDDAGLIRQQDDLATAYLGHFKIPDGMNLASSHRTFFRDAGQEVRQPKMEYTYRLRDTREEAHTKMVKALKSGKYGVEPYEGATVERGRSLAVMGWGNGIRIYASIGGLDGKTMRLTVEWDD